MPLRKTTKTDTGLSLPCQCGASFPSARSLGTHRRWCQEATAGSCFWGKVEKRDGCWGWSGVKNSDGYPRFIHRRQLIRAHRFSYELHKGPIPAGVEVMHMCDVRWCTNPEHLRLGTHAENMADSKAKKRHTYGEKNPRARITDAIAAQIIAELTGAWGEQTRIARKYGVESSVVHAIAAGRMWKHIPRPER